MSYRETLEEVRGLAGMAREEASSGNVEQAKIYCLVGIALLDDLDLDSKSAGEAESLAFLLRAFLWSMENK